ncbi:CPA1 family monovalent cation:H+ antiporter, variant [Blastomyces dermatitidis ER-3]|uniref:Sodium/hydrogen exchanger n=3 Tax=Blastomyces TaxID=229219 RepID=A0A179UN43_BLAGS|nr:CPA1 family monovalent cation:H+ antiporter [Blastomyces gilchristii SLH14081]XP_031577974.1 CPA1 family monovalent cation:H+ antiporter, variant [Blastomyces gilchristii SLH14081]XP_045274354.1 CPA1 family monovalent cation:H+ antiporter [Blastomyces dermatitidis ER-3]XP_045279887.1 CPA1 family monovalent cation:H+ antiporter, variant [Blastomyces dermatitidis ER-3]EQL30748.1 CPA1 family monovalent cation:H+ antiporter [Blastomyces dermatitidis ATCC 26199]EEQ86910.1 CPA1 family monovalent 
MAEFIRDVLVDGLRKRAEDDTDPDESPEAGEKELFTSWALFILIMLLITALFTSYILQQRKVQAVHETVISIFAGMVVGLIIRLSPGTLIQSSVSFDYQFFFNLLLPPIILASGYELHQANFFRNIGTILTFAFAGTFISALVLGLILYLWSLIPLDGLSISFVEAFSVGATLSATDPVTILAIFNVYKVEPKLYTVIFGESILNDAIAIVLFETAQRYRPGRAAGSLTLISLFEAVGVFLLVFFGSLVIGVAVGMLTALGLKYTRVRREPKIESCLIVLIAYASYFFSTGVHLSGIVSLLFCGITLKHYAYYNMSRRTQLTTKYLFQVLAQLSENFIFIYLGLDLFTEPNLQFKPLFIMIAVVGICVARYMSVFPLSKAINWFIRYRARRRGREVADELPVAYQGMLFWAGLRGAVGVALAAGLEGPNAPALRATVLVVVVLTVIIFGGTTARMLEILEIRTGVVEEIDSDDEFDIEITTGGTYYKHDGTGVGHIPRRNGYTVPLDTMNLDREDVAEGYSSGNNGSIAPRRTHSSIAARKQAVYGQSRSELSRDHASTQNLLANHNGNKNGSASGSSADDGDVSRNSPFPNRPRPRVRNGGTQENDADIDDFELDLDTFSDDDLPPAAPSRSGRAQPGGAVSSSSTPTVTSAQQRVSPARAAPLGAGAGFPGGGEGIGTSGILAEASRGAAGSSSSPRPGATDVIRDLFSGGANVDHAAWFRQLDEDYIKPKLLLDPGSGHHHRNHKGPGAV